MHHIVNNNALQHEVQSSIVAQAIKYLVVVVVITWQVQYSVSSRNKVLYTVRKFLNRVSAIGYHCLMSHITSQARGNFMDICMLRE